MYCGYCAAQVVDNWYPGDAKKDKGVLLMVTAGKEGAVSGGEGFVKVRARVGTATSGHANVQPHTVQQWQWAAVLPSSSSSPGAATAAPEVLFTCIVLVQHCIC